MGKVEGKKVDRTTVNLTPAAQEIKDRLTEEWDLKKLLSATLILFDRQNYLMQKGLILEASGVTPDLAEYEATFRQQVEAILRDSRSVRRTTKASSKANRAKSG